MEGLAEIRHGLESAASEALKEVRAKWKEYNEHRGIVESVQGFVAAVDWLVRLCLPILFAVRLALLYFCFNLSPQAPLQAPSTSTPVAERMQEPWVIALLATEALIFISVLALRKNTTVQATAMIISGTPASSTHDTLVHFAKQLASAERVVAEVSDFATASQQASRKASAWVGLMLATRRVAWLQPCSQPWPIAYPGLVVYNAERINNWLAARWQSFASQPYFDSHGVFISGVLSAPLMLIMFTALVNYLIAVSGLLIQMKRKELRYRARERHRQEAEQAHKKKHK